MYGRRGSGLILYCTVQYCRRLEARKWDVFSEEYFPTSGLLLWGGEMVRTDMYPTKRRGSEPAEEFPPGYQLTKSKHEYAGFY
jgi:hypothetical protein